MARQFDVTPNPDAIEAAARPYLIVLQSDLATELNSAVVAPLVPLGAMRGASRLNPMISVEGQEFWLATHELFAIDRRMLRQPVANLADNRYAIIAALDLLFTGI